MNRQFYITQFEEAAREQNGLERLMRDANVVLLPMASHVQCDHEVPLWKNCPMCAWLELSPMLNDGVGVIGDLALELTYNER